MQRPGAPDGDRRGQQQAYPLPAFELRGRDHGQHDHGRGEGDADGEAAPEVADYGVVCSYVADGGRGG